MVNKYHVLQGEAAKQVEDAKSGEGRTEAAAGSSAEEREREEEEVRQKREAEFDEQIRARAVRVDLLGLDRHCRRYSWLQGEGHGCSVTCMHAAFRCCACLTYTVILFLLGTGLLDVSMSAM